MELNGKDAETWVIFDPSDIDRLFAQDAAIDWGLTTGLTVPVKVTAAYVEGCRNAALLPFSDRFVRFIELERWRASELLNGEKMQGFWRAV